MFPARLLPAIHPTSMTSHSSKCSTKLRRPISTGIMTPNSATIFLILQVRAPLLLVDGMFLHAINLPCLRQMERHTPLSLYTRMTLSTPRPTRRSVLPNTVWFLNTVGPWEPLVARQISHRSTDNTPTLSFPMEIGTRGLLVVLQAMWAIRSLHSSFRAVPITWISDCRMMRTPSRSSLFVVRRLPSSNSGSLIINRSHQFLLHHHQDLHHLRMSSCSLEEIVVTNT